MFGRSGPARQALAAMKLHEGHTYRSSYRCRCSSSTDPRQPRATVAVVLIVLFQCRLHYPTSSDRASPRSDGAASISCFLPDMLPTSAFGHCNPGELKPRCSCVRCAGLVPACPAWGPEEGSWPSGEADRGPRWALAVPCSTAVLRSTPCLGARRGRHLLKSIRLHPAPYSYWRILNTACSL